MPVTGDPKFFLGDDIRLHRTIPVIWPDGSEVHERDLANDQSYVICRGCGQILGQDGTSNNTNSVLKSCGCGA